MDKRLTALLQTKFEFDVDVDSSDYDSAENNVAQMLQDQYAVNSIIERLNQPPVSAGLPTLELDESQRPQMLAWERTIIRAQGVVGDMAQVTENLRPAAPLLVADRLHAWAWDAAAPFWETGHFVSAVESAAKNLTAHIQQKSGSKHADRELVQDVFSPDGKAGRVRLWMPGDRSTDTWRSKQQGLHNMAMGVFSGIRNVAAHAVDTGWTEQEALEHLAVLSTVARWADATGVVPDSGV